MSRLPVVAGCLAVAVCAATAAPAQTRRPPTSVPGSPPTSVPSIVDSPRVSPTLRLLEDLAGDDVPDPPFASVDGAATVEVLIRHRCRPTDTGALLPDDGASFDLGGERIAATTVRWPTLDRLAATTCIRRVEPARLPGNLAPLEATTAETGVHSAHFRPDDQVDGEGTTIALLDSPVDILHPAFFRPDAGRYLWLDVDGDGAPTAGTDAVDLDRDGNPDHNETLQVLDATTVVDVASGDLTNDDGIFAPDRDWLYADMNGDRRRNAGRSEGFREADPAYAEPTFVADDVDRNGSLDPREALYRLGSSKIERLVRADQTYRRGENLISAVDDSLRARSLHGTSVAGVLVGGQLGFHRRVGVAPRADLVVFGYPREMEDEQTRHLEALDEAGRLGADVFLSEWTNPFVRPLDGSTNLEAAMQRAREQGLPQVVPVGNLNRAGKHLQRDLAAGASARLDFEVPAHVEHRGERHEVGYAFGSFQWTADTPLQFALAPPGRDARRIPDGRQTLSFDSVDLHWSPDRTPEGTRMVTFYLRTADGISTLPDGDWAFTVEGTDRPVTLYGRITDDHTGWAPGVGWANPRTDESTVSYPATAEAAVGVAAYAGRRPTGDETVDIGELRPFSGRGPRIDGHPVVDIAAPDNPFVPVAATPRVTDAGWGRSWFHLFGGTSGAAPHVAGSLALLRQAAPEATAATLEQRLFEQTERTDLAPSPDDLPDPGWGRGRLRTHRALYESDPPTNTVPSATLTVTVEETRAVFDGTASVDPDDDALTYRFDLDHDGRWETDWRSDGRLQRPVESLASRNSPTVARLEIRDAHGARAGALADIPPESTGGDATAGADACADAGPGGDVTAADTASPGGSRSPCSSTPDHPPPGRILLVFGLLALTSLVRLPR